MGGIVGPCFDLAEIKRLVSESRYVASSRVRKYLINHGYIVSEVVVDVVCSIEGEDYYKSDELKNRPGTYADIYRHVKCYGEEWYVKLFLDDDEGPTVSVWSMKEDGYQF